MFDWFAGTSVRLMAREEAVYAIRDKGDGAVDYLTTRAQRTQDLQRRRVYRMAAAMVPHLLRDE